MSAKNNYIEIILEDINGKFDRVVEAVLGIQEQLAKKVDKSDLYELRDDIKIIKYSMKQSNATLHNHESRITKLDSTSIQ